MAEVNTNVNVPDLVTNNDDSVVNNDDLGVNAPNSSDDPVINNDDSIFPVINNDDSILNNDDLDVHNDGSIQVSYNGSIQINLNVDDSVVNTKKAHQLCSENKNDSTFGVKYGNVDTIGALHSTYNSCKKVSAYGNEPAIILGPVKKRKVDVIEQKFFFEKSIETDLSANDIDLLFKYYQEAVEQRDALLMKISTLVIDVPFLKDNDKKTRFYTGLPTWSLLHRFYKMVEGFLPTHFNCKLSRFQMLTLTLIKLRLNPSFTDIGYRFQVDETTAARYFYRCLFILFKLFKKSKLVYWPQERKNLLNTPSYFRSTFKEKITIIVDCFEIFIERSSILRALAQAFSYYKHHETLKYLIGISVTGAILFVSRGYGGRASDKEVVNKSGFLDNLEEGDLVLADKGFLIRDEVEAREAFLRLPTFVKNGQLHPTEVEETRETAHVRIHVERVICVLREKFNICSDTAPMSAVAKQNQLFDNNLFDKIVFVCSCLVNICPSVVPNDFEV